jgi:hypothetical protein
MSTITLNHTRISWPSITPHLNITHCRFYWIIYKHIKQAEIVKQDPTDSSCKQPALQNKFTDNFGSNTFTLNPEFFLTQTDIDNITENAVTESGVNSAYNREEWHDKVKRNTWITT